MTGTEAFCALSTATTRIVFVPGASRMSAVQLLVPRAVTGGFRFTVTVTAAIPLAPLPESAAVPVKVKKRLVVTNPLRGLVTVTTGAFVSGTPSGSTRSTMEPESAGVAPATAMR